MWVSTRAPTLVIPALELYPYILPFRRYGKFYCRNSQIFHTHAYLAIPLRVTLLDFNQVLRLSKARVLPCRIDCIMVCSTASTQHCCAWHTGGRTDRQTPGHSIYRASIASRGKKGTYVQVTAVTDIFILTKTSERALKSTEMALRAWSKQAHSLEPLPWQRDAIHPDLMT